jgi:hypothetical protein
MRNGAGQYNPPNSSWFPATNGVLATASDWTALLNDLSAALTQSVSRDGQSPMLGNLNLANNKITNLAAGTGAGEAATWAQLFGAGVQADIASAATTDIGVQNTSFLRVTGTTTITSFGSSYRGPRFLTFEGAVTLTHSSTLVLPGNANITTAAGDSLIVIPGATLGTADKWVVVAYQKNQNPASSTFTSVTTDSLTVNGNNISATNSLGFRNRIINGDMRIDQRNAGASVTPGNGDFTLDRWAATVTQSSKFSVQRNAGAVTPPVGFSNYLGATSLSAYSVTSGDIFALAQRIEGFNFADMSWGTANAQAITMSFWVRSSLTGTFGGALQNDAENRSYPFSLTISAANTWEYKTVTVAGDTTGTWVGATNGVGVRVVFNLGCGTTRSNTAGAWAAGDFRAPTGAVSVVGTSGATFYITGVQLEAGSVATPFERRPYGTELALCQRYYEVGGFFYVGYVAIGTNLGSTVKFVETKRASPTLTQTNTSTGNCSPTTQNASTGAPVESFLSFRAGSTTGAAQFAETWTASSEL